MTIQKGNYIYKSDESVIKNLKLSFIENRKQKGMMDVLMKFVPMNHMHSNT